MPSIYLDFNSTAPMPEEVLDSMLPFLKDTFANPSSIHQPGQKARKAIEESRSLLAKFINAESPDEIIFTSGGTESNNLALQGTWASKKGRAPRIVSTAIEHNAVRAVLTYLKSQANVDYVVLPVHSNGIVDMTALEKSLTSDTILVSVMGANNEVGTIQPISEISKLGRKKNITFHCDGVQLAGKEKIDVQELGVDMLSLSAHKFGGPKGIGLLYVRKGTRLESLIHGGTQEKNRRGGTEHVAGIVGMAKAAQVVEGSFLEEKKRLEKLRNHFENKILMEVEESIVNGDRSLRVCNTTNIRFNCIDSSEALVALDLNGVACSVGSACQAGSRDPSHVLTAMGLSQDQAHSSLRFSLGPSTTDKDVDDAVSIIKKTVQKLREHHPLWKEHAPR